MNKLCGWCNEPILESELCISMPLISSATVPADISFHHACHARQTIGSVGHQRKQCSCYGGQIEDPPKMTKREAAIAALAEYNAQTR